MSTRNLIAESIARVRSQTKQAAETPGMFTPPKPIQPIQPIEPVQPAPAATTTPTSAPAPTPAPVKPPAQAEQPGVIDRVGNWASNQAHTIKEFWAHPIDKTVERVDQYARDKGVAAADKVTQKLTGEGSDKQFNMWEMMKSNPSLLMIPLGIIGMMSGNNVGRIVGLLATAFGGQQAYELFKSMKSPEYADYLKRFSAGETTPQEDAAFNGNNQALSLIQKSGMVDLKKMFGDAAVHQLHGGEAAKPQLDPVPGAHQDALGKAYGWAKQQVQR